MYRVHNGDHNREYKVYWCGAEWVAYSKADNVSMYTMCECVPTECVCVATAKTGGGGVTFLTGDNVYYSHLITRR